MHTPEHKSVEASNRNGEAGAGAGLNLSRREVLVGGLTVTVGLTVLGAALPGCQENSILEKPALVTYGVVNIGPASNYPAGTVKFEYLEQHGIAIANEAGRVLAIRPVCTHAGCAVVWVEERNQFACPCHGSTFNMLGQVLKGPARKTLPGVLAVKNDDGTLSVDLDKLYGIATPVPVKK